MDLRKLKSLLELMDQHSLSEMEVEEEGMRVKLRKFATDAPVIMQAIPSHALAHPSAQISQVPAPNPIAADSPTQKPKEDGAVLIKSPMVGTFYRSPRPDAPPFCEVGKPVDPETLVCIIEAMKVMNEIKAECSGTVAEFLVQNGEAVEYGQPMIRIAPRGG